VAARRGKNQARRSGAARRSGLTWLAGGLVIGGLAFGYLHYKEGWKTPVGGLLPTPNPDAQARATTSDNAVAEVPERPKRTYDFYKLLPEKEVLIPDAELDAQVRAEAKRAAEAAARAAAAPAQAPVDGDDSLSLDGNAASPTVTPASPTAPTAASAGTPVATGPSYVIQAGAFRGNTEAESLKAKIAMTGEIARVEIAQINGNTVHRVRMGPYPNAASLAAAKAALAAHGIDAQAIRVK
jgi:cell division protein FtsN